MIPIVRSELASDGHRFGVLPLAGKHPQSGRIASSDSARCNLSD